MTEELRPQQSRPSGPSRSTTARRVLAVAAGIAMVPALYAAANAATGGGERPSVSVAAGADDTHGAEAAEPAETARPETETETSGRAARTVAPTAPSTTTPSTRSTPSTVPGVVDDHGRTGGDDAAEVGDDHGGGDDDVTASPIPAAPVTQTFASAGGTIEVTLADGTLTLGAVTTADGFTPEVHAGGGTEVEVRFVDAAGGEWRVNVEIEHGTMASSVSFHS